MVDARIWRFDDANFVSPRANQERRRAGVICEVLAVGPLSSNCILLGDEETREALVIDPGDEVGRILAVVQSYRFRLRRILVTHAHIDHIGGASELKQSTGARLGYHASDVSLLPMMALQAALLHVKTPSVAPPDDELAHGDRISLGRFQGVVLHTPGHTRGSICLHFPAQSLLCTGDTLLAGSLGRTDLPGGSAKKLLRSLGRHIAHLPPETIVIPGHGATTDLGREWMQNPHLQSLPIPVSFDV